MSVKTHDFFVFYYEECDLGHRFAEHFVNRWEREFNLKGLYFHRDAVVGKTRFGLLEDSIERSKITVVVFTRNFMNNDKGFSKYANIAAFTKLLNSISSTPCYIPVGVGLDEEDMPSCIRDVLSVAKFPEYDWDEHVQIWRQLDNVLIENDLLTEEQMKKLGRAHKRYIRPAERLLNDKFLRDHVASQICYEYFSLGIGLNMTHQRLEQIKKTDTDPLNYIFKMLVTWREESEKYKMTEKKMLETLLEALKDVERLDVYEEVNYYAEEFEKKRQKEGEDKEQAAIEASKEIKNVIQEETNQTRDYALQTIREPNRNENTVRGRVNEQTSVMKPIATTEQGYVRLHRTPSPPRVVTRLVEQGPVEKQVVLSTENDLAEGVLQSSAPLIPQNSEDGNNQNGAPPPQTVEALPRSVPFWTLPIAVGVTMAVTAVICMRLRRP